jgi:hypothetical protein
VRGLIYAAQGTRYGGIESPPKELEQITAQGAGQAQYLAADSCGLGSNNGRKLSFGLQKGFGEQEQPDGLPIPAPPMTRFGNPIRGDQRF